MFTHPPQPTLCGFLFSTCQTTLFSFFCYVGISANGGAAHGDIVSLLLLLTASYYRTYRSALYRWTHQAYISSSLWQTKFHTHVKQKWQLQFCTYTWTFIFCIAYCQTKHFAQTDRQTGRQTDRQQAFTQTNILSFTSQTQIWFVKFVRRCFKFATLKRNFVHPVVCWNFANSNKDTCPAWANYGIINDQLVLKGRRGRI